MNKIKKTINEMNNKQKYLLIIIMVSGLNWFITGYGLVKGQDFSFSYLMKLFFLEFQFSPLHERSMWFENDIQILSFCIMIGCLLGYYLFKEKK